jgi:hypothetical protein
MRVIALFCIFIIADMGYTSRGQQAGPPQGQISPSEILRKNLIATGGLEAHKALESLVASGEFRLGPTTHRLGDYKFYYQPPGNDMFQLDLISHGTTRIGHRGEQPIQRVAVEGAGMLNGISLGIMEQDWRTLLEWDFCCNYSRIELVGMAEVDKRLAYALRFTPKRGDPFVCFYDRETFLLVRTDQIQRFQTNKKEPEVVYRVESFFRNYRPQGAIKLPMVIAIPRSEGELVFEVSKVKLGGAIADSVFQ